MLPLLILAGGLGTRLSEYTETIPKPMITIGGKPIISHIINYYVLRCCIIKTKPTIIMNLR